MIIHTASLLLCFALTFYFIVCIVFVIAWELLNVVLWGRPVIIM